MKILRKSLKHTVSEGCAHLAEYMDKCGSDDGHLIVFDRDPAKAWEEKIFKRTETFEDWKIVVWGM